MSIVHACAIDVADPPVGMLPEALTVLERLIRKDEAEALHTQRSVKVISRPDSRTPVNADSRYRGNNG